MMPDMSGYEILELMKADERLREVPVIVVSGLSEGEKRALALADNKIAENAGWDRELLAAELGELSVILPECDLDIAITGFDAAEIDGLLGDLVDDENDPADEPPILANEPVSRVGDLWVLGRHRLLCGDATKADDVATLMGGDRAAMVFTDPPYNVAVSSIQGRGQIKHREFLAGSGEMSRDEFEKFLADSLGLAANHTAEGSLHYVCMDWKHLNEMLAAGERVYGELKNLVVWAKTNAGQGSLYRSQHELIFVFKSGDAPHLNNVELGKHGRNRSNVWSYPGVNSFRAGRLDDLSTHPTVKPVAMVADAMRDCSRRGDVVLDPFMGSGSTLVAAKYGGRKAIGIDTEERYCEMAAKRLAQEVLELAV
jgi:DNA modification methylase